MNETNPTEAHLRETDELIAEMTPVIRPIAVGRFAISIGGSHGKKRSDALSDVDFRLFCDEMVSEPKASADAWDAFNAVWRKWEAKGRRIDGCWVRKIADIDRDLDAWLAGKAQPDDIFWTIWGYHLLTDLANQRVIEDPFAVVASWKERLSVYPPALKTALLTKHLEFVRYWRGDYHYENKAKRGDVVFLSGLAVKLVHSLNQILYALNETYYSGDGYNLDFARGFAKTIPGYAEEVERILYPPPSESVFEEQRERLCRLITAVEELAEREG